MGGSPAPGFLNDAAPDPLALLDVAREAAMVAGPLLVDRFTGGLERAVGWKTSPTDMVSEADLAAERAIRALLGQRRPHDGIVGEEGETVVGSSGLRWVVDPLDGTINFLFGIPQWCVSVAVEDDEGTIAGVVLDPCRAETFGACRGGEATLNGVELRASAKDDLADALVATGFAYDATLRARQAEVLVRVLPRVRDIRRAGSAALDLAWTAAGRHDAFYERSVKPWDVAAGALVCERAGLEVVDLPERDGLPFGLLAVPRGLRDALLALVC